MKITVFGGASLTPTEIEYQQALKLGNLLAQAGHTVLTGGYMGSMEAVSRGAAESGAHVIGVTCAEIEDWRPTKANPWVKEELKMATLQERMIALMDNCDAAIALPGGAGTLAEISLMWNRILIQTIQPRPIILVGQGWKLVFDQLFEQLGNYFHSTSRDWLFFVDSVENAVDLLPLPPPAG